MICEEIEEGELTSEDELPESSSNLIESGEVSEGHSPGTNKDNPYAEEDEDMIELKMKALKSLLDKETTIKKVTDKNIKKKSKKLKIKKKIKKYAPDKLSPNFSASSRDNYELKDMDIDPIQTNQYPQFSPSNQNNYEQYTWMQNLFQMFGQFNQMLYSQWTQQQQQQQQQQHHQNMPINQMNMFGRNSNLNKKQPKKKNFKPRKNLVRVKNKFPYVKNQPSVPTAQPLVDNSDEIPLFNSNGLDVDERFLDTTTTSLDIDYRQLSKIELLKNSDEKVEVETKIEEPKKSDSDAENEAEMLDLRKNLLDTLNLKRNLKKKQEQELKIDQDISLLKKKLAEHEQVLFQNDLHELKNKIKQTCPLQKSKIAPVIIRISANDDTSDDEEEAHEKKKTSVNKLDENIGLFLKEAKQMANETDVKNSQEKQDVIKSLRDRINLKSKMLFDLSNRSKELDTAQIKKQKDIDFTKLKIAMLKEQLQVSEKILQVNEQALKEVKSEKRSVDLRFTKLQNMKKTQQEMLQKLLSTQIVTSSPKELPRPSPVPTPKPRTPLISSIMSKMTLGSAVAETVKSTKNPRSTTNQKISELSRPNLTTSKATEENLENLLVKNVVGNSNQNLNENIVVQTKVFSSKEPIRKNETKKFELENRQKLIDFLDELTKDYPHVHSETFDLWSYESLFNSNSTPRSLVLSNDILENSNMDTGLKASSISVKNVLTSSNFCNLNECETSRLKDTSGNEIHVIDDVRNYESPLRVFRGYRFSSHFSQFSPFDESYSKTYCNAIDYRRPFCPFDLHGSCKDSNCIYQHSNVLTMDNYQRTEHFLSYCPQVLELSSDTPTQREAIKKLKLYAKQFMNNNLNKMSIRDYFKHLYDHVVENLKLEPSYSTILSRLPILCINNNKSIGVFDHLELESNEDIKTPLNNQQFIKLNTLHNQSSDSSDQLLNLLDLVYTANYNRTLDSKFKKLIINSELDLSYLLNENNYLENEHEKILSWVYYAKMTYSNNFHLEKLINIFSHALESRPKCELLWLLYLKTYLHKNNSLNDYHEICLLCMDNLMTYDLVWFIMNTCPLQYVHLIFDKYENYLVNVINDELSEEFEQGSQNDCADRVSYYLFELIVFNTYVKLVQSEKPVNLLTKYLNNLNITNRLEPNDLSLLWLCLIHLEAFNYLPNWLEFSSWTSKNVKSFELKEFWVLKKNRMFNMEFFNSLNFSYKTKVFKSENTIQRQFDIFLIPWKNGMKYACSIERIQNLFHEGLRSINTRCPANSNTTLKSKQEIRLFSLPLFINLINLEVSNKRYEIASKIIDRLLKSADAKFLKELWIILIYILKCQNLNEIIEKNLNLSLQMFPNDPHLIYLSAQHYESIGHIDQAVLLIEDFITKQYSSKSKVDNNETIFLFQHYLGLVNSNTLDSCSESKLLTTNRLSVAILYCYYLQLKGVNFFTLQFVQQNFEKLIRKFNLSTYRCIIWIRYFKFMSTLDPSTEGYSDKILSLIQKCTFDLNSSQNFLIPFNYVPSDSVLRNSGLIGDFKNTSGLSPDRLYYSNSNTESTQPNRISFFNNGFSFNCTIDYLLKNYTRSQIDKISLTKFLLDLTPTNTDLIKQYVLFNYKQNGLHKTLQYLYDHLSMNSINNEHLWLLCIKLCLDMNDLQQAVLIFHKADLICSKGNRNLLELKKIGSLLLPSMNESDVI